jgi:CRISPR/Cas system CSM-associated protein Csm3 (group 7 of RAMP superfamily)
MHARFYNEAIFRLTLSPRTPLLIKSGVGGDVGLDPTLPDMNFVRTHRPDRDQDEVYIPGSSLRGVVRSHAERLLRSIGPDAACDSVHPSKKDASPGLKPSCGAGSSTDIKGDEAYRRSCHACRIFGNTMLAGRARVSDFYLSDAQDPVFEIRYGVAIDRVTAAVAQGPFEMEILTQGTFAGQITLRNFTLAQFGLLAAALLDIGDGLVPIGYAKSRGLGRVSLGLQEVAVRTLRDPLSQVCGVGALCDEQHRQRYGLPNGDKERFPASAEAVRRGGFWLLQATDDAAKSWLDAASGRWPEEVRNGGNRESIT